MTLYFTSKSRDKSFSLLLFVKTVSKLVVDHSVKFKLQILKIIRCGSRSPHNAKVGHFAEDGKEMYQFKNYNAREQALFCSLNLLFSDVPVAVVAFFLILPND